jgi:hypothetical protein
METLRDKSKRLLRQTQTDTTEIVHARILGTCTMDYEAELKTVVNIHLLDISDDIKKITEKLEDLVSDPRVRPEVRKDILDIISMLV